VRLLYFAAVQQSRLLALGIAALVLLAGTVAGALVDGDAGSGEDVEGVVGGLAVARQVPTVIHP